MERGHKLSLLVLVVLASFVTVRGLLVQKRFKDVYNAVNSGNQTKLLSLLEEAGDGLALKGSKRVTALIFVILEQRLFENLELLLSYCPDKSYNKPYKRKLDSTCETSGDVYFCSLLGAAIHTKNETIIQRIKEYMKGGCGTCLAERASYLGLTWQLPDVEAGRIQEIECPLLENRLLGTWRCKETSAWDSKPDISNCPNAVIFSHDAVVFVTPEGNVTLTNDVRCEEFSTVQPKFLVALKSYVDRWVKDSKNVSATSGQQKRFLENVLKVRDFMLGHQAMSECAEKATRETILSDLRKITFKAALSSALSVSSNWSDNGPSRNSSLLACMVSEISESAETDLGRCDQCIKFGFSDNGYDSTLGRLSEKTLAEGCKKCLAKVRTLPEGTVTLDATTVGESFSFPCHGKKDASAEWRCNTNGLWDPEPDRSPCVSIEELIDYPNKVTSESATDNITSLANRIAHVGLYFEDIYLIVKTLRELLDKLELRDAIGKPLKAAHDCKKFYQSLMIISDKILEEERKLNLTVINTIPSDIEDIVLNAIFIFARCTILSNAVEGYSSNETFVPCMVHKVSDRRNLTTACDICTAKGPSDKSIENINLIEEVLRERCGKCLTETHTVRNTTWTLNATARGDSIKISCPFPSDSTYGTWRCQNDTTWNSHPDLSLCRSNVTLFTNQAANVSLDPIMNLTNLEENIKGKEDSVLPGDVLIIMDGLKSLQEQQQNLNDTQLIDQMPLFLEKVVEVTSFVMSVPNTFAEVSEESSAKMFTDVQERISESAVATAKHIPSNTTVSISKSGVDVTVSKKPPAVFKDVRNRQQRHPSVTSTQLDLPDDFYIGYETGSEDDDDGDDEVILIFQSYETLHCKKNSLPCNPKEIKNTSDVAAKQQVNSVLMGAIVGTGNWSAKENKYIKVNFSHIYDGGTYNLSSVKCSWWNTANNNWSFTGCEVAEHTKLYTICHCTHLTNLGVLMDVFGYLDDNCADGTDAECKKVKDRKYTLHLITVIGCPPTIIFLILTIASLLYLKKHAGARNRKGNKETLIKVNLCICLALFLFLFLVGLDATSNRVMCGIIAAVLHFLLFATFTWNAIEGFDIYQNLHEIFPRLSLTTKKYLSVGYGMPLVFVVGNVAIFRGQGYGNESQCWMAPGGIIWGIVGFTALIILINLTFYSLALRVIWIERSIDVSKQAGGDSCMGNSFKKTVRKIRSSFSIFLILGLTWMFGFFSMIKDAFALHVIYVLLCSFQGVGIFVFEIVLNKGRKNKLQHLLKKKFQEWTTFIHANRMSNTIVATTEDDPYLDTKSAIITSIDEPYSVTNSIVNDIKDDPYSEPNILNTETDGMDNSEMLELEDFEDSD